MKCFVRSLMLWVALAGNAWLLMNSSAVLLAGDFASIGRMLSLSILVWLTWFAVGSLPKWRLVRWSFWTITMAGWLFISLLLAAKLEGGLHRDDRQVLYLMVGGAGITAVWIAARVRRLPSLRMLGDIAIGLAIVGIVCGVSYGVHEAKTQAVRQHAVARWSEIGLPLAEFEKSLKPVTESEGTPIARDAFRDLLGRPFYRANPLSEEVAPVMPRQAEGQKMMEQAVAVFETKVPPTDEIDPSKLPPAPLLDAHAVEIDAAFRRILAAEPPRWATDPADFLGQKSPDFIAIRMFAQLGYAESLRRSSVGDVDGAARAVSAARRMAAELKASPSLTSLMIHVGVESFLARSEARWDFPGSNLGALEREAAGYREAHLRATQWEALAALRIYDQIDSETLDLRNVSRKSSVLRYLPRWSLAGWGESTFRRLGGEGALNAAESVAVRNSPESFVAADFGSSKEEAIFESRPTIFVSDGTRASMRIHVTLLLREQAILVRESRARLDAGQPVESRNSVVMPHLKWELLADPVSRTVSTRLVNAPEWIVNKRVTSGDNFWVIPIDGSVAWKFAPKGTAGR